MTVRALTRLAGSLAIAALAVAALTVHGLYTAKPLELIIFLDAKTYPSAFNWAARNALYWFHPTDEEVRELNSEAGARYAAEFSDPEEAEKLLRHFIEHGVGVDSADQATVSGWTALHAAAIEPNPQAVRLLLAHGANPGLRDRRGKTPLDLATEAAQKRPGQDYSQVIALLQGTQGRERKPSR